MRAQGILLVLAAILALLWIVALDSDEAPVNDIDNVAAARPSDQPPPIDAGRPGLAPQPAGVGDNPDGVTQRILKGEIPVRVLPPKPPPTVQLQGRIVDAGGAPVPEAVVYQLGKQAPKGTNRLKTTSALTDEAGWFQFPVRPVKGTWIGVKAFGHVTAFVDGDGLDPEQFLRVVLKDPLELRVVLLDAEGQPIDGEGVRVMPITNRGVPSTFPGPRANEQERLQMTDENGVATFTFNQTCPVVVIPEVEGASVSPTDVWLAIPEGSIEFVAAPGVTIRVRRKDADGTVDTSGPVWFTIHDEAGRVVDHLAPRPSEDGRAQVELSLGEGHYALHVSAKHREPAVVPFVVTRGGQTIDLEVTTQALAASARLTLVLPAPPATPGPARARTPLVFVRRVDSGFLGLGWQRVNLQGETAQLRPGAYEVAVMDRASGSAALIKTRLQPGETARERVLLRGGTLVRLADVIPEGLAVRSLRVEVPGLGWFPPAGTNGRFQSVLRGEEAVVNALDQTGADGLELGPYPGPSVVLHVTDWRGRAHAFAVR